MFLSKKIKIKSILAYEVLDSRGFPTVAVVAHVSGGMLTENTAFAKVMVPSGASTGKREALELRDGEPSRYYGKGVKKAVENVNQILAPALINANLNAAHQKEVDEFLINFDGTENKGIYGANAILGISLAVAKAVAKYQKIPFYRYVSELMLGQVPRDNINYLLPVPMVNVINGGEHADNTIDFQEFMFMPIGAKNMHGAVRTASECFHSLQKLLKSHGYNTNKGDEGGFAPNLPSAEAALSLMVDAVKAAGYTPGINHGEVAFALDCAASELYDKERGVYVFQKAWKAGLLTEAEAVKTTDQMIDYLSHLVAKFPIISIEDGLDQSDWAGFAKLVERLGQTVQLVGDDLFCTNPTITQKGIEKNVANAVLVKVNQIGTLTETLETIKLAKAAGWNWVLSHRSGETEDTTIADLAVGTSSGQIKTGSMSRSERIAKYNRLLEIELEVGHKSQYPGLDAFRNLDLSAVNSYDHLVDHDEAVANHDEVVADNEVETTEASAAVAHDQVDALNQVQPAVAEGNEGFSAPEADLMPEHEPTPLSEVSPQNVKNFTTDHSDAKDHSEA